MPTVAAIAAQTAQTPLPRSPSPSASSLGSWPVDRYETVQELPAGARLQRSRSRLEAPVATATGSWRDKAKSWLLNCVLCGRRPLAID